jgi:hypothetical protein
VWCVCVCVCVCVVPLEVDDVNVAALVRQLDLFRPLLCWCSMIDYVDRVSTPRSEGGGG